MSSRFQKFKTYKSDAAPFFFFLDVFPSDPNFYDNPHPKALLNEIKTIPVMPLPMRVDRVFNGEMSVLIRPAPISFPLSNNTIAIINPQKFIQFGLKNLLHHTEIFSHKTFFTPITSERVYRWWNLTKHVYGKLSQLEDDFSAFLRTYIHTLVEAKINDGDLIKAAKDYCQQVSDICQKRMFQNRITVESRGEITLEELYKKKNVKQLEKWKRSEKIQYHPELIDIELSDISDKESHVGKTRKDMSKKVDVKKYIALLFYDDLQECMLQNLELLKKENPKIIDPGFLIDEEIIILKEKDDQEHDYAQDYSWFDLNDINLDDILNSIRKIYEKIFYRNRDNQD